jgi:hypothetical protein
MSMNHTQSDDQYTYDGNDYVESGTDVCPYPGFYNVKPLSVGRAKDKEGNERKVDGWPILRINRVQIDLPDGQTSKFAVFQDVRTKPSQRPAPGNTKKWASQAADVLRAIDVEDAKSQSNFEEVYQTLENRLQSGDSFISYVGLTARDSAYIKAKMAEAGQDASQETKNKIFNEATLTTKDFRNPDGTYRFVATGPSGATLSARPTLSRFVSSDKRDEVELGPQQVNG